VDRVAGRRGKG
jgi:hypothetical protein